MANIGGRESAGRLNSLWFCVVFLVFAEEPYAADQVILSDGTVIEGKSLRESDTSRPMEVSTMRFPFLKKDVREIRRDTQTPEVAPVVESATTETKPSTKEAPPVEEKGSGSITDFIRRCASSEALFGNLQQRRWLEEHGLRTDLMYTADFLANTRGGLNTNDAHEYIGNLSLYLELDTKAAGLWDNGTFFAHVENTSGRSLSARHVGDYQVISNIDAEGFSQLSEFWYKHLFLDETLWVKFGKQEAAVDFAAPLYGSCFITSSAGTTPTIPIPVYPDQDLGIVIGTEPVEWFSMNVGAYQARPDGSRSFKNAFDELEGPVLIVEPAFHYSLLSYAGHIRLGAWWNGDDSDEFDLNDATPGTFDSNHGTYLVWDQQIYKENPTDDADSQGMGFFAQYGWSPEDRSELDRYFGGGLAWMGAIPNRNADVVGVGVFNAHLSDQAAFDEHRETIVEAYYKAQIMPWFSLKPDIQYIHNPGGTKNSDAVVTGVRVEVAF